MKNRETQPSGSTTPLGYFMRLGFKNIFRQRTRAMLALSAIALSVALVVVGATMTRGVEKQIFSAMVAEAGELVVARQDYFDKSRFNPLRYSLKESDTLQAAIQKVAGVRSATERIDFGVLVAQGEQTKEIRCSAVDVDSFVRYSSLPSSLVAGRFLRPGEQAIVLGKTVVDGLGLKLGDPVSVLGRTAYESFTADDFELVGVFDLGSTQANRMAFVPLAAGQRFLEMEGASSRILIYGAHYDQSGALAESLRQGGLLPEGTAVRTWRDDRFLAGMHQVISGMRGGAIFIICFVAGLGILNMMMVYVLERRREIGVLMALGMSRGGIIAIFLYEAFLYGLIGSILGLLVGVPVALYTDITGFAMSLDRMQGLPVYFSRLHGDFAASSVALGLGTGVILGVLGMAMPVLMTFSMSPLDAIRKG